MVVFSVAENADFFVGVDRGREEGRRTRNLGVFEPLNGFFVFEKRDFWRIIYRQGLLLSLPRGVSDPTGARRKVAAGIGDDVFRLRVRRMPPRPTLNIRQTIRG